MLGSTSSAIETYQRKQDSNKDLLPPHQPDLVHTQLLKQVLWEFCLFSCANAKSPSKPKSLTISVKRLSSANNVVSGGLPLSLFHGWSIWGVGAIVKGRLASQQTVLPPDFNSLWKLPLRTRHLWKVPLQRKIQIPKVCCFRSQRSLKFSQIQP